MPRHVRPTGTRRRDPRAPGLVTLALGIPLGLVLCGALVWQASYAAFTVQTSTAGNSWTTGTVVLADDDGGSAMFTAADLRPGSTLSRCIAVTSSGSLPAEVRLFTALDPASDAGLADALEVTVEAGTGGSFAAADCDDTLTGRTPVYSGSLSGFAASHGDYATGAGSWAAPGGTSSTITYRFTVTLPIDAPNATQGTTAGATFTWQARST